MSGIALSHGSILAAFQGKRVYQPVWQVIYTYVPSGQPPAGYGQLLLSDGQYLTYNVALHPHCTLTFNKTTWKSQNSGRTPEDIVSLYRFPIIKVMDMVRKEGDHTTVLFLSKVKLMGWERGQQCMPGVLRKSDVEVVLGSGEVVLRSREGLDNFEDYQGPNIEICSEESENNLEENSIVEGGGTQLLPPEPLKKPLKHKFSEEDLICGVLSPLGPCGLDILKLCTKCQLLTYQNESKTTSFKPPTRSLAEQMKNILNIEEKEFEFCSCDDENEQFRKEFQNKCMVVNQDVGPGPEKKVQCILVSKEAKCVEHCKDVALEMEDKEGIKELTLVSSPSNRIARVSNRLRLCERCGVEDTMMSACRQCGKVWYCTPACKRADVRHHSVVCRAHITIRRYTEERAQFAAKLREPEDGCGNCGYWRDGMEPCTKCGQVSYCCYRCKDKSAEKHRIVCEAFCTISSYRVKRDLARQQEVD